MNWQNIISCILSFVAGGGLLGVFTLRAKRRKANVEVKVDEITALNKLINDVYIPTIEFQNERVRELEKDVRSLRKKLSYEYDNSNG